MAHKIEAWDEWTWFGELKSKPVSRPIQWYSTVHQATRSIHTDCLLNYETVKYFGGEEHEGARYREALREYQALEYKVTGRAFHPHHRSSFRHWQSSDSFSQSAQLDSKLYHRESTITLALILIHCDWIRRLLDFLSDQWSLPAV